VNGRVRIAAAGDLHASQSHREALEASFARIGSQADIVLLAGDLTTHGNPAEARVLADICRGLEIPIYAVLGNHDHHEGRGDDVAEALRGGGIRVLQRDFAVHTHGNAEVGIVGTKGFVGGFPGSSLPDFGEPLLRQVYAETSAEVAALERGLQAVAHCDLRVVLMHYAPVADTLAGEPLGIQTFLGSARLAIPIAEYQPDLVLHGHAHAGSFEGSVGETPVYNVAVHVTGRDFYVFDLELSRRDAEVEVEGPT
jgi:uncharacterized protein